MAKMKKLVEAFEIFMKYNPDQWLEGAEHDVIYGPAEDDIEVSKEDLKRLSELGWFLDEDEGWKCFV